MNEIEKYGYEGTASILSEKIGDNLDNAYKAGYILAKHIRNTAMDQRELLTTYGHLFNAPVRDFMLKHYDTLSSYLDHDRDFGYMYKPMKTLIHNYLFKVDGVPVEHIQWFYLRLSVQVSMDTDKASALPTYSDSDSHAHTEGSGRGNTVIGHHPGPNDSEALASLLSEVRRNYEIFSRREAIHATPTCVNAGFKVPQLESCFLVPVGDSMEEIQAARTLVAMGSKANGGFGLDCGRIRHGRVSNRGITKGVPGMLMHEFNPLISYADQLGSRPGAMTAFLPIWHVDIPTFIRMGDRKSPESIRATNLNYSLWVQDLFHKRRLEGGTWTLFCPRDTQRLWCQLHQEEDIDKGLSLHDMWGPEFEAFYLQCERYLDVPPDQVYDAQSLWEKICIQRCQTGQPFIMNGDNCNRKSNHQNQGTITQSNLCVRGDTLIMTSKGYTPIHEVADIPTSIWNGQEWSTVTPRKTGIDQPLLTVTFSNGSTLHCTHYHRFYIDIGVITLVEAKDLQIGDILIPWTMPDGTIVTEVAVTSIEDEGEHADTYCFNEPKRHMGLFNGVIASNCQEVIQYTKPGELAATCDLATVNLVSYVRDDGSYDWDRLGTVVRQLVRNLNRVLDSTSGIIPNEGQKVLDDILATHDRESSTYKLASILYGDIKKDPTYTARMRNRAIGIGKMGLASTLAMMGMEYTSKEASLHAARVSACIYWHALDESCTLAQEEGMGSYSAYDGSPMSKGILQQDMWNRESEDMDQYLSTLDHDEMEGRGLSSYIRRYRFPDVEPHEFGVSSTWDHMRDRVSKGIRNSLLTCQMPNVTTSAIYGVSPSIEPFFSMMYATSNSTGNDMVIYDVLRTITQREGIYDPVAMGRYLSSNEGDITGIHTVMPDSQKDRWLKIERLLMPAFNVNKKKYLMMVQRMGYYIDQSQSLNWFFKHPNDRYMANLDTLLWVNGAKNGQYYVHRKAAMPSASVCTMKEGCTSCQ